jgi:hypothetical protein
MTFNPKTFSKGLIQGFRNAPIQDPRWSGRVHWGPFLLIPITCLLIIYLIFTLIALIYSATNSGEWKEYSYTDYISGKVINYRDWEANTPVDWQDPGSAA